ncbi:hypothetical protein [Micromonospora sp. NPDC004704]
MTTSPHSTRTATGPLVAGDLVDGRTVAGFAYAPTGEPPSRRNDRLLFTGDEHLGAAPDVVVPLTAEQADRRGIPPVDRLPHEHRSPAKPSYGGLPAKVEKLLRRADAPWRELALPLFDTLRRAEHDVWISGGAIRDLLLGKDPDEVKDLDLAGTVPAGRYFELTYLELRALGGSEADMRLSPDTLVVWTEPADPELAKRAHIEYRGLGLSGFAVPGTGSDLSADAAQRDFTVNALHYDRGREMVLDPAGTGISDLTAAQPRLICCRVSDNPRKTAAVIIRAIKFVVRWEGEGRAVDLSRLAAWSSALPPGLWSQLDATTWHAIRQDRNEYLPGVEPQRQLEVAARLGPHAIDLIARLSEVTV